MLTFNTFEVATSQRRQSRDSQSRAVAARRRNLSVIQATCVTVCHKQRRVSCQHRQTRLPTSALTARRTRQKIRYLYHLNAVFEQNVLNDMQLKAVIRIAFQNFVHLSSECRQISLDVIERFVVENFS